MTDGGGTGGQAPGLFRTTTVPRWTRSGGLTAGAIVAVAIAAAGLILARIDLALLSLPLVAALMLSYERRPDPAAATSATVSFSDADEHEIGFTLTVEQPERVEAVVLWYSLLSGEPREIVLAGRQAGDLAGTVPLLHSGPQELVRVEYRLLGSDAATVSRAGEALAADRVVAPRENQVEALPLPPRLQGMTGSHQSARAGDGGEFRDIHPFTAGDKLRRIDWKATARRGQNAGDLYVRRTAALADATVLIVLDSRDDVGEQVAEWSRNTAANKGVSSLDVAREAATTIATGYIQSGDRVGFQDLSSRARMITHAGGGRHLWRLLRVIETTAPTSTAFVRARAPIVPSGALVYLLSSMLDDQSVQMALTWRGSGHRVIAVDVLPPAQFLNTNRYDRAAHRLVMMQRDDRLRILRTRGVELLRWRDEHARLPLTARLQLLSRPARGTAGGRR